MKKILMTMVAAFAALSVNAQFYVGGGVGYLSVSHDGETESAFTLLPEFGYNLNEDMSLGIAVGYGESGKDNHKIKTTIVNPYLRYNVIKNNNVKLFLDGSFDYSNTDSKALGYKVNEWGLGVKPGVAVSLTDNFSFVAHMGFLGYRSEKPDYDGAKATNTVGLSLDATDLSFGFYYNF